MNSPIAMVFLLLTQGLFFMNFVIANAFMQKQIYKALNSHATQTKAHIWVLFDGIFSVNPLFVARWYILPRLNWKYKATVLNSEWKTIHSRPDSLSSAWRFISMGFRIYNSRIGRITLTICRHQNIAQWINALKGFTCFWIKYNEKRVKIFKQNFRFWWKKKNTKNKRR